mgnify:CR=1 FL=1
MELTVLLAKVFGLYMVIVGVAILMNRKHMMLAIIAIAKERFAQLISGIVSVLLGLLLVNIHNDWSSFPACIVSLIGWTILVKGCFYLFMPEARLTRLVHVLTERSWSMIDGVLAVIVGLYLAGFGFNWF